MVNIGLVELDYCGDCVGGNASSTDCQEETDYNYDASNHPAGIYIVRLTSKNKVITQKNILLK